MAKRGYDFQIEVIGKSVYDDAKWHSGGDFPEDLPPSAGATHIGMFLAWAMSREMVSEKHMGNPVPEKPGQYLLQRCEGMLRFEDLCGIGNEFAWNYYSVRNKYVDDLQEIARGLPTAYHLCDDLSTLQKVSLACDRRFKAWRRGKCFEAVSEIAGSSGDSKA